MNDTTKRRLQSTSLDGDREYGITAYCDDFKMGLTLTPLNFDINEINWGYGLPGFNAPFIKVGIRAGESNAATYALQGDPEIHILLNSREMKDYAIILDRPNSLSDIASDAEFKKITRSLFEYLNGNLEGDKLLFNGVFPEETIEFSPPNKSASVRDFLISCSARVEGLDPRSNPSDNAGITSQGSSETASAKNIAHLTETISSESLEASDGGDGFYFRTVSGKSFFVTSNSDEQTPGANFVQVAATNQQPVCLTVAGEDVIKITPGACT
jgi:hypothetical protein